MASMKDRPDWSNIPSFLTALLSFLPPRFLCLGSTDISFSQLVISSEIQRTEEMDVRSLSSFVNSLIRFSKTYKRKQAENQAV